MRTESSFMWLISSIVGGCPLGRMCALSRTSASSRAPFAAYPSSKKPANSPAPDCTATSKPASVSLGTSSGTSATRCSPGTVSFGTLTIMGIDTVRLVLARYSNPAHESCYLLMRKEVRGLLHAFFRVAEPNRCLSSSSASQARVFQYCGCHAEPAPALEGAPSRHHLIENRPQREYVTPPIDLCALHLLRRHVLKCSDDRALLRHRRSLRHGRSERRSTGERGGDPRQTEIQKLRSARRQHDVARLQVAMDDPLAMSFVERVGNLCAVFQSLVERQRTFLQTLGKRLSLHALHYQVVHAILLAHVIKHTDVRMIQT